MADDVNEQKIKEVEKKKNENQEQKINNQDTSIQDQNQEIQREQETKNRLEQEREQEQQIDENDSDYQDEEHLKIGWGIFIIALIIGLAADVVEVFTLGTLGWFVGLFLDFLLVLVLLSSKPTRKYWKKWTWGPIIETIPIINTFPFIRAGFLIWAFISSRSKTVQKISKLGKLGLHQ